VDESDLLRSVAERAIAYRAGLANAPVTPTATPEALRAALGGPTPEHPADPSDVIRRMADVAEAGGLMGMGSGRFFGFVIGGAVPASLAADWLVTAWDQNTGLFAPSPATSVMEEIAGRWLVDMLGLPDHSSFAFVTGGQMANTTALAAARHHVLATVGWDVEVDGLAGSPPIRLVVSDEVHVTVPRGARLLGLGARFIEKVAVDANGAMIPADLERVLSDGQAAPTIVCCQAGNINTGALDPTGELADIAHAHDAWLHVDGAIGLWAAASGSRPEFAHLDDADSWSTDAHKWLNVPYDSGLAFVRDGAALRAAMAVTAEYLPTASDQRNPADYTPELSRRARGVEIWAVLRSLGRSGLAALVERTCRHARRFAEGLAGGGYQVLNDVVLNQVLVSFGDADATNRVIAAIQADGTCWCGGTIWQGQTAMRISVSSWATTDEDVERSLAAILRIAARHSTKSG